MLSFNRRIKLFLCIIFRTVNGVHFFFFYLAGLAAHVPVYIQCKHFRHLHREAGNNSDSSAKGNCISRRTLDNVL